MSTELMLRIGSIIVTDQSEICVAENAHAVCVDVDPAHDGPRIWVSRDAKGVVNVYLHPDEGDASHVFEWRLKAGAQCKTEREFVAIPA
jgi:hypothetical protein